MKNFNFKTLLLAIGLVVASTQPAWAGTKRIFCKMEQGWWKTDGAAVGCHSWGAPGPGTTWPGVRMTPVEGESDMWYIDLDTDKVQNVIFTRVNGSGNIVDWGAKTKDQTIPTDGKNLFTITTSSESWGDLSCDGEWSEYAPNGAIVGSMNSWDPTTNQFSSGSVTITLEANKTYEFKVLYGSDYYSNNSAITSSISSWGFDKNYSGNCHLTTAVAGNYTFEWNSSTKKLSVTYPAITHPSADYYYVKNVANWSQVNVHLYHTEDNKDVAIDTWGGPLPLSTMIGDNTFYYFAAGAETKATINNNGDNTTKKDVSLTNNKGKYYDNNSNTWKEFKTTITLDNQSATTAGAASVTATYGQALPSIASNKPAKTGYSFGGYYTEQNGAGTQYIKDDGASAKNWDKTDETITLYAKWTETKYNIAVKSNDANMGTVASASVQAGQITSVTLPVASVTSSTYKFVNWTATDGITITNPTSANGATIKATKAGTVTANFALAETYDLTVNKGTGIASVTGGVTGKTSIPFNQVISATLETGYAFHQWEVNSGTVSFSPNATTASVTATVSGGSATITAKASEIKSNLTASVNSIGQAAGYSVSGAKEIGVATTATLTTSTAGTGYTFTGWTLTNCTITSGSVTSTTITVKGSGDGQAASAVANYAEDLTTNWRINLGYNDIPEWIGTQFTKRTGESADNIAYVEANLLANHEYRFKVVKKVNDEDTWYGNDNSKDGDTPSEKYWIKGDVSDWTFETDKGDCYMRTKEAGTYTFKIDFSGGNPKVSVTYPAATTYKVNISAGAHGSVSPSGEQDVDEYVGTQVTATPDAHYTFANWEKSTGITTTSEEATTTVKASQAGTLKANFKGSWTVRGQFNDWAEGNYIENYDGNVGSVSIDLAATTTYKFKVFHHGEEYAYGNDGTMSRNNCTDWTFENPSDKPNCEIYADIAGTYTFTWDVDTKKLSVTYPALTSYTVNVSTDGNGTVNKSGDQQIDAVTGFEITATPNPGYHFDKWVVSSNVYYQTGETETSNPAHFYVNAEGQTIQATFAKNTSIYFNNTMQDAWGTDEMYVYFYSGDGYWDGDKGTGSNSTGKDQDGNDFDKSQYFLAGPCQMTRISKTNIWEYAYDPTTITGITGVVFADKEMTNYDYFVDCNATRRMDFKDCANMFVLSSESPKETKNGSANYYSTGFWRGYNMAESKMYLHIREGETMKHEGEMIADFVGSDTYSFTATMESQKTYNLYVGNCTGMNFSNHVQITSENCSGVRLYEYGSLDNLGWIYTAAAGDYKFSLTFNDDIIYLSVEYPITQNDYRVKIGNPARYSNIIRAASESGTISMYLAQGTNTFKYEYASDVDHTPITWTEDGTINVNVEKAGVYTMTLHKNKTIDNVKPYTGEYYVRTDCAQGGWQEYKTNDNNLMHYTDRNPKFIKNQPDGFNYYYCRWCANESSNVRFVVANEINACISDTMKADALLDDGEFLKGMANIRFSYNSNTNALSRAYISGSYNDAKYMQIRSNDSKLFEYTQTSPYTEITAKSFADENDWTYTMDVYADGGAQVAVSAYYNNKYQFFVGTGDVSDGTVSTTETLLKAGSKQHLRLVYDFKTDRLISGWTPSGEITETIVLDADMLLVREAQQSAAQINISTAGIEIQEIKTIYSVLQLNRDKMLSQDNGILATDRLYENAIYWISFPFDVAVNDIFGIDGYGTKWVIQYYDGDLRSKIGFFKETETFWTYLGKNDTIRANVGYALCLDPDYFDSEEDEIWANNRQSVCFYFPSADRDLKIVGNGTKTVPVPAHECTIDRTFGEGKNHKNTDTDWNVIGSPAFQDLKGTESMCTMYALYQWNPATNGYSVATVNGFDFQTTHAYLVQFHGNINWQNASVINPTVAPAPRYAYADEKNYTVELMFYFGNQWDRAYVALKDNANEDFVLSEDLTKMMNAGQPNIYSYAGAYDVAYNGTAFKNQTVNLGVVARKNGTYTFSMPKEFSGTAKLIDLVEGITTDLNISNYSVDLNKGTYNDRFQLLLEVEAKAPTSIQADGQKGREADGKTTKLLRNGNIYLINAGRVYNATGAELR